MRISENATFESVKIESVRVDRHLLCDIHTRYLNRILTDVNSHNLLIYSIYIQNETKGIAYLL